MGKFRYRLQNILNIRLKMEDQARQNFSEAKIRLDEEETKLEIIRERKEDYENRTRQMLMGSLNIRDIENGRNAVLVLEEQLHTQQARVEQALRELEEARERMKVAMQERKTQETLREKAFQEFLQEENRTESKVIDELTSYTYGQKAGDGKNG